MRIAVGMVWPSDACTCTPLASRRIHCFHGSSRSACLRTAVSCLSRCVSLLRRCGYDLVTGEVINIQHSGQTAQLLGMDAGESAAAAQQPRPRAAMVILARDQDLDGVLLSMGRLEARFNSSQYRCVAWSKRALPLQFLEAGLELGLPRQWPGHSASAVSCGG